MDFKNLKNRFKTTKIHRKIHTILWILKISRIDSKQPKSIEKSIPSYGFLKSQEKKTLCTVHKCPPTTQRKQFSSDDSASACCKARVRFSARHPREVFLTEVTSDEEIERNLGEG
jgi:hypothetical protein